MLVHLIDERDSASVRRSGIKGLTRDISTSAGIQTVDRAVFAMPVLQNYFASHQWVRELKRRGMRSIAAAYFRLRSDAHVWVGKYNGEHRLVPLGHAAGLIMREPDPRGWEIVVRGAVPPGQIHAIRPVPQVVGWRFFPESHDKGPWKCLCSFCLAGQRGDIKSRRLRERLLDQLGAEATNFEGDPRRFMRRKPRRSPRS